MINLISNSWMIKVLEIAKKLAVTSEGFEDVIQEGNMALFLKLTELCGCEEKQMLRQNCRVQWRQP